MDGIYTLANDVVYDQLIALLNSIEVNVGTDTPVCVIAYDDCTEKVQAEIEKRKNVQFLDNSEIFIPWEEFSYQAWKGHPNALSMWAEKGIKGVNRIGMNRRYCGFDPQAPFEKFMYFDADILVLNSVEYIFDRLDKDDFVVYDFQYKDPSHIFNLESPKLLEVFPESRIKSEIFCAGFYAGKRGLFYKSQRDYLVEKLNSGEGEILYTSAPNQSLLNYMKMRLDIPVYNFGLDLPPEKRTGCSVTSPHFEEKDHVLYDKGERLTYLHYIGVSSKAFAKICAGENIDIPYRDIFLHYRYLHEAEKKPK
ncbi:MAG: sugar transferase, partial [Okeania sp. SIO4D6]|nr:sugar transferase [Okeania sp. SIO4D6]